MTVGDGRDDDPSGDGDLVRAAQGGDRRALEDLLRRHQPMVHAVCRRMTGHDADAADASQEALVSIVRHLARFDGRSRFSTWAYRIAVNASIDELRRRRRRPEPGLPGDDPDDADDLHLVATGPSPEGVALRLDVDRALLQLPVEFRACVVLRDLCGLDYAEIGEVLGLPPGTVRSRISRGRAALVPHLAPLDEQPAPSAPPPGDPGNPAAPSARPTPAP